MPDYSIYRKERIATNKFYNQYLEEDDKFLDEQVQEYLTQHPDATAEEAFRVGYLLSEEHPTSRAIHNAILYVDDYSPIGYTINLRFVFKKLIELFKMRKIEYKTITQKYELK